MKNKGQSTVEYFVMMAVLLLAIIMTGVIDRIRNAFDVYFVREANKIVGTSSPSSSRVAP